MHKLDELIKNVDDAISTKDVSFIAEEFYDLKKHLIWFAAYLEFNVDNPDYDKQTIQDTQYAFLEGRNPRGE